MAELESVNLRGANLSGANLSSANLTWALLDGANLQGAKLQGTRLLDAELTSVNFRGGDLSGANLSGANLSGADLLDVRFDNPQRNRVNFRGANLRGANLSKLDLRRADLSGAILVEANLDEADLSHATLAGTVFGNADLSNVKGLDTINHEGPSIVGIETAYLSGGKIPETFLRCAGILERYIAYLESFVELPIEFYSCFISYSHSDKSFARRLHNTLQGHGIRCWLDEHKLLPGDDIYEEVDRSIRLWDKVLLCCSEAALRSWWVDNEIGKAFAKEQTLMKERGTKVLALIPLNLDGYLFRWQNGKADEVRRRMAGDFVGWQNNDDKYEMQVQRVISSLRADDGGREPPPAPRL